MNWVEIADTQRGRYVESPEGLDERALVRSGNAAYAAGLALLMAGDPAAAEWLMRAAVRWRESWDAAPPHEAWGRPIGALKAALLAGDDAAARELAGWTLRLGTAEASSPIGRYAAALALLTLERWPEARHVTESLRGLDDFPDDVAEALAFVAAHDPIAYIEAAESVIASFEARDGYLEDIRVADTALVLGALARRRGIEQDLPESELLPSPSLEL